jgi:hypothetical protein
MRGKSGRAEGKRTPTDGKKHRHTKEEKSLSVFLSVRVAKDIQAEE